MNSSTVAAVVLESLSQSYFAHRFRKDKSGREELLFHIKVCFPLAGLSLANLTIELYPDVELTELVPVRLSGTSKKGWEVLS